MIIQQGDVIIESIGIIPANTKAGKLSKGHIVLAEGETTGHAHRIAKVGGVVFKEHVLPAEQGRPDRYPRRA